jgi:heme oxygenase
VDEYDASLATAFEAKDGIGWLYLLEGAGLCASSLVANATDVSIEKREDFERLLLA